jgi:O-antigen ligase
MVSYTGRWQALRPRIGVAGLFVFAFAAWFSVAAANIGLGLLVLAFLADRSAWDRLRSDPLARWGLAFAGYLVVRALWAAWELPQTAADQAQGVADWLKLWLFVCVAWWLHADLRHVHWALALALAGLLAGMLAHIDWGQLQGLSRGERSGFQLRAIAFGLYSSTALLGLWVLAPRLWRSVKGPVYRSLTVILSLLAMALLAQGLISTQSRGAWMAALLVMPAILLMRVWVAWQRRAGRRPRTLALAVGGALLLAGLVAVNWSTIQHRLGEEQETLGVIARGDFAHVPLSPIGWRVHLYRFGLEKFAERPLLGWGPGSTQYLISHSGRAELQLPYWKGGLTWLDHLHNTYLEVLVRFGLVGALLLLGAFGSLVRGLWIAYRSGRLPVDYALFLLGGFGLTAIWNLFDFRLTHFDWRFYWLLLAGTAYSFTLQAPRGVMAAQRVEARSYG